MQKVKKKKQYKICNNILQKITLILKYVNKSIKNYKT